MKNDRNATALLICLAFLVRLIYLIQSEGNPLFSTPLLDAERYFNWAKGLAAGENPVPGAFFQAPLYPYLISVLIRLFGATPAPVQLFQFALGITTVVFIRLTAKEIGGTICAWTASLLFLLSGLPLFYEGQILSTSLEAALISIWVYMMVRWYESKRAVLYFFIGATGGLICLARPNMAFVLLLLLLVPFAQRNSSGWKCALALFAGAIVAIAPVTARNALASGDFVLISANGGLNFYIGNHYGATGIYSPLPDVTAGPADSGREIAERFLGRALKPSEISRYWFNKGIEFIGEHPLDFVTLCIRRAILFYSEFEIPQVLDFQYTGKRYGGILGLLPVTMGWIAPAAIVGLFLRLRKTNGSLPLHVVHLAYLSTIVLYFFTGRFRYAVVSVLCVSAGLAVARLVAFYRKRAWGKFAGLVGVSIFLGLLCNANFIRGEENPANMPVKVGIALMKQGRYAEALDDLLYATKWLKSAEIYRNIGDAHSKLNNYKDAVEAYLSAKELNPNCPGVLEGVTNAAIEGGMPEVAIEANREYALNSWRRPICDKNLTILLYRMREVDRAIDAAHNWASVAPEAPEPWGLLADIYINREDWRNARIALEHVAALDSANQSAKRTLAEMDRLLQIP